MSKPAGWDARRAAASTITGASILFLRDRTSVWIAGAILLIATPASADEGQRALRLGCDRQKDAIAVEPFIIWNGEYRHNDVDLNALRKRREVSIGSDTYIAGDVFPQVQKKTCRTITRTVTISLIRGLLLVTEKTAGKTRYVTAEFHDHIGSAWDVAGPTYRLGSARPDSWQACTGYGKEPSIRCEDKVLKTEPPRANSFREEWAK